MADTVTVSTEAVSNYLKGLGMAAPNEIDAAVKRAKASGERITVVLVKSGTVDGDALMKELTNRNGDGSLEVDGFTLSPRILHILPESAAVEHKMLPIHRTENILWAAVPSLWSAGKELTALERRAGVHIEPLPVREADVHGLLVKGHQLLKARSLRERRIGSALVERGLITPQQLQSALSLQKQKGLRLGQALVELGYINAEAFYQVLSERLRMPLLDNTQIAQRLDPVVAKKITQSFSEHNMLLPYGIEGDTLKVAISYPSDPNTIETLKAVTGARRVDLVLVDEAGLRTIINAVFAGGSMTVTSPTPATRGEKSGKSSTAAVKTHPSSPATSGVPDVEVTDIDSDDGSVMDVEALDRSVFDDPEVPRIINYMLFQAVKKGSSDVHIEQYEDHVDTKFRIDGQLRVQTNIPVNQENVLRIISKIKIDCKLDIAERRKPQDGACRKRFGDKLIVDFRVATQPTLYGENVVMRILDRTSPLPTLNQLGMPEDMLHNYMRLVQNPQGMIIFTGPTGSGKTTTLYCTLNELRKQKLKIITAEDPIEYQFDGIQQCQVHEQIGNTFAKYLRGFLRQDPDVILIGEIRDQDTAVMATRAAITGHLLFSTIHANDSVGVVRRIQDMGVDPSLLGNSFLCVVYQRLLRRICASCKTPYKEEASVLEDLRLTELLQGVTLYKGMGCEACDNEGYRGRIACYELWEPNDEAKDNIASNVDDRQLRQNAFKGGLKPIVVDGVAKLRAGVTTIEELREVVPYNQIVRAKEFIGR